MTTMIPTEIVFLHLNMRIPFCLERAAADYSDFRLLDLEFGRVPIG
jgi:hypothetical protein